MSNDGFCYLSCSYVNEMQNDKTTRRTLC